MREPPLARIENLCVSFQTDRGPVEAVRDLSFDIQAGEILAIVGESGSGKSVTALALMRLVDFDGGDITGGRMLFHAHDGPAIDLAQQPQNRMRALRGARIGMIFQEPMTALNPVFTIGRQLTEVLREHLGLSRKAARDKALKLLEEVRIPDPVRRLAQHPHELSGGMRQRVMIAMALACEPRLLIADEPTTALDVTTQAEILVLINRLRRDHGTSVLFITHDMGVVAQVADRVMVMKEGRKIEEGALENVFTAPTHAYTRHLIAAVPRLGGNDTLQPPETAPKPSLLSVENLTKRFPLKGGVLRRRTGNVHAVEDVSFSIGYGQTLAIVGESGCGKSTVGRSVLRLLKPDSGRVILDGQDLVPLSGEALRRERSKMQMVFQDPYGSFNPVLRLSEQVAEPLQNFTSLDRAARTRRVADLFDRVGLSRDYLDRYPHEVSGGQRQRVAIARALALNPKLIVADEAVSALDVSVQRQVLDLMAQLQNDLGISFLFISHDMAVVEQISHRIAVMYAGRIVEQGPVAAVLKNPQHPYTRALLAAVPSPDPTRRIRETDLKSSRIPSGIHPIDHVPGASVYRRIGDDHLVLCQAPDV